MSLGPAHTDSDIAPRQQGSDSEGRLWITRALERVSTLQKDTKHLTMVLDADEEIQSLQHQALTTLSEVEKASQLLLIPTSSS